LGRGKIPSVAGRKQRSKIIFRGLTKPIVNVGSRTKAP